MIVVDANVLAFYVIEGRRTREANTLREMDAEWIVPAFWRVEFESILWKYVRFGGMPAEKALDLLDQAVVLFSVNESSPPPDIVLRDALNWGITVYDAQYVSLARQSGVPCISDDLALQRACPGLVVSLGDFINRAPGGGVVRERQAGYRARRRPKAHK